MNRILSITLLCCMLASISAIAQVNKPTSPALQPATLNDETKQAQTFNKKDNTLNAPNSQRVNNQGAQEMKVLKEQSTSTLVNTEEQRRQQRIADENRRLRLNYESAIERFNNAKRDLDKLLEKQKIERQRLSEKQAKEAVNGLTEEMTQRHEAEIQKLDTKHARQLMDAQSKLEKAMREYEAASSLYEPHSN